ncbi:MAG: PilZ domain-containing protein [Candidatus Omnitrophica bacterium]|nr:PilZ domain-containing protein [Candidatus Omnitrophota bacterium]
MGSFESRRAERKGITLKGNFRIEDDLKYKLHIYKEPVELTIVDIGVLGCGFVAPYYLPKGLILLIRMINFPTLTAEGAQKVKDIEFTGRVMACRTTAVRANRVGLEFVDIRKEDLSQVQRFVSEG